jgi:AmmeMemoRadiSam system protein A
MATEELKEEEGKALLVVARKTIDQALFRRKGETISPETHSPIYSEQRGTFVTLTLHGRLRGCIGHITPQESLLEGIRINALNAAFRDPRFRPLSKEEWENVKIEISILTAPKVLSYNGPEDLLKKLRLGVDGVIIQKGMRQSTFLPQVWEQLVDKRQFLTHLCMKAGLEGDAWEKGDLVVSTYQVQAFEE